MRTALLTLLLSAGPLGAAPPALDVPAEVRPAGQYVRLLPKTDAAAVTYVGLDGVDPIPADVLKDPRLFLLDARGLKPGRYRFAAVAASKAGEQARADFAVTVGDAPKPDDPPKPDPALPAVPGCEFGVLVVCESARRPSLPAAQQAAMFGGAAADYMRRKCSKADGRTIDARLYDPQQDPAKDVSWVGPALALPRASDPWLVVVKGGKAVHRGPFPATEAEYLAVLKKHGGD